MAFDSDADNLEDDDTWADPGYRPAVGGLSVSSLLAKSGGGRRHDDPVADKEEREECLGSRSRGIGHPSKVQGSNRKDVWPRERGGPPHEEHPIHLVTAEEKEQSRVQKQERPEDQSL
jgi:hypothetical protein